MLATMSNRRSVDGGRRDVICMQVYIAGAILNLLTYKLV